MVDAGLYLKEDVIAALSTAPGRGAVAVVRVTGRSAIDLTRRVFQPKSGSLDQPRLMVFGRLVDPQTNETIDEALCVAFHAPRSYTGENLTEIQCHGGEAVVRRVLELLYREGARPAEPGEFTFRAVCNGKMDLSQAEAVGTLIESRSQLARSLSLRMLEGAFSIALAELREHVTQAMVELETQLEFPDEAMEADLGRELKAQVDGIVKEADALQQRAVREQRFEQGVIVVLAGQPNVGKSSLFNRLLGRDRAIVTPHAGTTRDSIEGAIELQGRPVTLIDTAGLRETHEEIEAIGVERSRELLTTSHIVLLVFDASQGLQPEDKRLLDDLRQRDDEAQVLLVANKSDLGAAPVEAGVPMICASALQDDGVDALLARLQREVEALVPADADSAFLVGERQARLLAQIASRLHESQRLIEDQVPLEAVAEELRAVLNDIAELDGSGLAPDIMTTIFSRFCIGK
ncbi:MAG: tRNA uridine-5-carboxymethylaminomethyl(34) synthesis GTPase MnmE [Candidatus Hinthialibacter antarcticus]|nr:tRNA uridine-5-carboxymethylaminomethyl(34) synthesis GTPase MnmE [Candidatus Hinthialibacter antarcticus]